MARLPDFPYSSYGKLAPHSPSSNRAHSASRRGHGGKSCCAGPLPRVRVRAGKGGTASTAPRARGSPALARWPAGEGSGLTPRAPAASGATRRSSGSTPARPPAAPGSCGPERVDRGAVRPPPAGATALVAIMREQQVGRQVGSIHPPFDAHAGVEARMRRVQLGGDPPVTHARMSARVKVAAARAAGSGIRPSEHPWVSHLRVLPGVPVLFGGQAADACCRPRSGP